jgi:hypothetical protein
MFRHHHRYHQHRLVRAFRTLAPSLGTASLAFACSGGEVDLGGGSLSRELGAATPCADSGVSAEDLQITSQEELDALRGCEVVHGLRIEPFPDIDLTALASLRIVTDAFQLGASPLDLPEGAEEQAAFLAEDTALLASGWVYDLHGLEALESVATLYLTGVAIENLAELESLSSASALVANDTLHLRDFSGLEGVSLDTFWITNAPELESLNGLTVIPNAATIIVMFAPKLANVDALDDVEYAEMLMLSGTGLTTLSGFSRLGGAASLDINNNAELTNVDTLGAFQLASSIYIAANPKLASIPRFEQLVSFDTLTVLGNGSIESLDLEFPALQPDLWYVGQREVPINPPLIEVGYNTSLERIAAQQSLPNLQILSIYNNDALTEVDFGGLTTASALFIDQNPALTSVLTPSLRSVDHLEVTNNPQLSVADFEGIQTVEQIFSGNADPDPVAPSEPGEPADAGEPAAP